MFNFPVRYFPRLAHAIHAQAYITHTHTVTTHWYDLLLKPVCYDYISIWLYNLDNVEALMSLILVIRNSCDRATTQLNVHNSNGFRVLLAYAIAIAAMLCTSLHWDGLMLFVLDAPENEDQRADHSGTLGRHKRTDWLEAQQMRLFEKSAETQFECINLVIHVD